jgi:hypothetical protein
MAERHEIRLGHADYDELSCDRYQRNGFAWTDVPAAEHLDNLRRHRRAEPRTGKSTDQDDEPAHECEDEGQS